MIRPVLADLDVSKTSHDDSNVSSSQIVDRQVIKVQSRLRKEENSEKENSEFPDLKRVKTEESDSLLSLSLSRKEDDDSQDNKQSLSDYTNRAKGRSVFAHPRRNYTLVKDYNFKIVQTLSEAIRGQKYGSYEVTNRAPGFPDRKFSNADLKQHGSQDQDWTVQALYKVENDPTQLFAVYEGWTSNTGEEREYLELMKTAPKLVAECRLRETIMNAIKKRLPDSENVSFHNYTNRYNSIYWCYEDMSYFINQLHEKQKLGPVFFIFLKSMSTQRLIGRFPAFKYTIKNVLTERAREKLMLNPNNRVIDEKAKMEAIEDESIFRADSFVSSCPSIDCKCAARRHLLYRKENLICLSYSRLGLVQFQENPNADQLFLIECSDACGCDDRCPTRQCQNGQKIPLAICYDSIRHFEVRAGDDIEKGQFISEYIGVVKTKKEKHNSPTYLMDLSAVATDISINAEETCNFSRYFNHSCDPNAKIIEVHSRKLENELLVPRVGIYALRRIEKGEEICISYWTEEMLNEPKAEKWRTSCACNSSNCKGWIPRI